MKQDFNGSFDSHCQEKSVPDYLLSLVAGILYGPGFMVESSSLPQPALSISQLIMHNCLIRHKETGPDKPTKHCKQWETPLLIYLGILLHTKTRKRSLVDTLFDLGLCISYNRVLEISTELGNTICHHYEIEKAVCPPQLKGGLFNTSAIDNINHNPSSTSAHDSFHGTGISLFQHLDDNCTGVQSSIAVNTSDTHKDSKRKLAQLPDTYTNVPPVALLKKIPPLPEMEGPSKADSKLISQSMQEEYRYVIPPQC